MSSPKRRAIWMALYGVFLVATGLYGYSITANHSTSALFNGGIFGFLFLILATLHAYGRTWTHTAALSASVVFCLTFMWRAVLHWAMAIRETPTTEFRLEVAILLTCMACVSAAIALVLAKSFKR